MSMLFVASNHYIQLRCQHTHMVKDAHINWLKPWFTQFLWKKLCGKPYFDTNLVPKKYKSHEVGNHMQRLCLEMKGARHPLFINIQAHFHQELYVELVEALTLDC